jgi:transposase
MVCGVAIDMSLPYIKFIKKHFKYADIVFDNFHIAKHLNEPLDKVSRKENANIAKHITFS